ncbi:zinc finger homeobox protein 3-like [Stegastes partitus]|uniref:Zinc finger homeobox protein 3-like n=1 Tax=Stegastes partitus TaxID=144197 RepID=A0A9Y4NWD7_9TELE|nr:PREDICTED: zinc finger homeobox protein 3-like [Stegastes partitus]
MDSGEGGGGDGGGGEERDADLSPQALSLPLLTLAVIPEQGSSSHTSAMAPAKEPLTLPQQEEEGAEGSQARDETQGGEQKEEGRDSQENGVRQKQGMKEDFGEGCLSGQRKAEGEVHVGVGEATVTGGLPAALSSRGGEEEKEEEEAISNQSQTKSKCSLLPQQSQHSSSSSTAKASGTLDSKTAASPKPSPFFPISPKHFNCPSSSSALLSETEVKDIKGDQGWISGFPQSFRSQQSSLAFPLAGTEPASTPAEDDGLAGVPHSSISNGDGAKAPEPNDSQLDTEVDDERDKDGEQKEAVLKNLNQDLSPNSLTSHMTIMHSRNSCKTLKCPKCNWHYKSQHTLQVHMKEKHPETGGQCVCGASGGKCVCGGAARGVCGYCSSGKPHPRLARGETYACGYKPYRCEVCDYATSSKGNLSIHMQSDKHLNNVQNGGHSNSHMHSSHITNNSSSSNGHAVDEQPYNKIPLSIPTPATQPAKLTPPAHSHSHGKRWRCDVCDYETSIARNLRIHTTSEKHTHNMLRLQRGYYLSHCRSLAPQLKHLQNTGAELSLNMRLTSQQVTEQPVTLGSTLTPSPSPSPSPPPAPSLSPTGPLSQGVFQCLVCSCFSSDSLESVEQHLNAPRSLPQSEWCSLVAGGCHCRLCGYTTPLRANFSLHCQTDRHRTRYQLAAHLQEGGDRGQEGAALIAKGNPVQLRCNLCDYVTSSLEKLRGHSLSSHHEASVRVYRFLQQYDGEVDGGSWLFHCLLCNHSSSSKLQVLKHSQTPTHQQREGLLQLQPMGGEELAAIFTIRKSPDGVTGELSEDMETSSETSTGPLDTTKDTCNLGVKKISEETEETRGEEIEKRDLMPSVKRPSSGCGEMENSISTKRPRTHQQNENQQTVQCPLCQVKLPYVHLRQHLTHVHSVAQDCVDKLISTVKPPMEQPQSQLETELQTDSHTDDIPKNKTTKNNNANCSHTADPTASTDLQKNKGISVENTEGDVAAPKDVTALLTPPLEDNTTHPSNGRLAPQSPTQIPPSSPPTSPPSDPPPLTDRHGYRFRCSRCSLAFPTQEKLQLHWQYHAMRAATECPLCSRQCRSQEALQRHMQNTHSQLDNTQGQNTLLTPHTVQYMEHNKNSVQQDFSLSPQVGQEAGEGEDEEIDEEPLGMEEKEEPKDELKIKEKDVVSEVDGCEEDFAEPEKGPQEEIASEPSSSSLVKKSSNPTMDRYLDPSRPYKCTICSESFTQKTILLVHYNSVSHLHRARRALQDSGTSVAAPEAPRGPDPRPYRCRLCGVGYSQSSTLDIHLRSVLHQTRARAAQNPAPQTSASTVPVTTTAAQASSTREETSKSLPFTKRPDGGSSSTSSLVGSSLAAEAQPTLSNPTDSQQTKKRVAELLASRNQLMLIQQQQIAQAQVQAQLQQHTALLQSQVMQHLPLGPENLLKQHFSLASDNLLALQQQLLLPFYLSGDMTLNPEFTVKSPEISHSVSASPLPKEMVKTEAKKESETDEKQAQKQCSNSANQTSHPKHQLQCEAKVDAFCSGPSMSQIEKEHSKFSLEEEKEEVHVPTVKNGSKKEEGVSPSFNLLGLQCPPPRVPYAAVNGEPLRALLQGYGYELALQYIQSRHRHQQQIAIQMIPDKQECSDMNKVEVGSEEKRDELSKLQNGKMEGCNKDNEGGEHNGETESLPQERKQIKDEDLAKNEKKCCEKGEKCRDCGKFFSDALILKSHQEYIHRVLFPTAALERFSREYRLQYDQMYPLTQSKSGENSTQAAAPATSSCSESEPVPEPVKPQVKTFEPSPVSSVSDPTTKTGGTATDTTLTAPAPSSPPSPSQPQDFPQQEASIPSTSSTVTSQTTSPIPLSLPKIPMLPLSLPQLSIPPLPLPKLPLPPIPFPMELPLLPPVVMQSVALQTQPWLEASVNPELAKLYQSQLNPALLGQQPQLSPALLAQQPQLSPALLGQPPQLNPALLSQPSQPSPVPTGQPSQVSPTILEQQQGKRTRTRISEEQLTVLRKHFDINSLPSDEEINKMSALSGLPHKVIKHWFRNTLFKERQRDKDSPYNFNNPPTTALEDSREDIAQHPPLTLSPCSLSPGLPANTSPQPQTTDLHRGELHRGRRSSRTRFTEQQLETLQGVFEATPYPREEEYDRLSALLSLPNRVIVVWFQNARQRARKSQDRGTDDGLDDRNQLDNIYRQRNGCYKNDDDLQDNSCEDEGQGDSQNENSMDLTYEYYTHPDSPGLDNSTPYRDSDHLKAKGEQTPPTMKQEDKVISPHATTSPAPVHTQNGTLDADIQHKEMAQDIKTGSYPQPEPKLLSESTPERPKPLAAFSTQKTAPTNSSMSHSDQGHTRCPPSDQVPEKAADTSSSLPSAPESERSHSQLPDATACLSTETQPQTQLQPQPQFQCSVCPVSLPSFQLWQEHQTRHLLAAQSQVQLLHSGFTDRTMPYMMLHPNHTLMASQMLSGAMSQLHPNPTHSMISHLNSIQIKNTLSDHSSGTLTSSLTPIKQTTKHISETSFEGQRGSREAEEEHRRDKRQRTTITPEQLEVLYQRYSLDSNPTRGVLESIARDVGLTRRVVQVWFQNTRARERKGQFRSMGPGSSFQLGLNHLRCPFCRALFKVKSALDAHMRSRHWAEAERAGFNLSLSNGSNGQTGMAMSSVMDRPGPSISSNTTPNPGYVISNKELTLKPPVTSFSTTTHLSNPEEDDDYEEDDEEYQCEEGSSMADQGSPSPEGPGGPSSDWGETQTLQQHHHQQQRQRTQMSHFQVLQLKDFYRSHRTPNRHECETLGQELGLPHRVVQVWFQNARAKEKRARSLSSDSAERDQAELSAGAGERDRA